MDVFLAARQVGASGRVIGVDMTPAMLEKANHNKAKLGLHNVEFRYGHIEALPVADNTVDVVMSNCVINLSPDKAAVFREAFRVLRPDGRLAVSDIVTEGDFSEIQRADAQQWAACVTGAIDVAEYVAQITAAGFVDVAVVDKSETEAVAQGPRVYSARVTARKPRS
jgi:ubiquinone/menaquinone biosynthesis C-methylase UbiE